MRILIHQKDFQRAKDLRNFWKERGEEVFHAKQEAEFLKIFYEQKPEVVVLDVWMKGGDSFALVERIRRENPSLAILFLSEEQGHFYKKKAFAAGADYYLLQETAEEEIDWHIQAVYRRIVGEKLQNEYLFFWEDIELNLLSRRAKKGEQDLDLSDTEFKLLLYFVQNIGLALKREHIMEAVWGKTSSEKSNLLDSYVRKLRKKIGDEEHSKIVTVRAYGYGIKEKGE